MSKPVEERKQLTKQYPPELVDFFEEIHRESQKNIESINQQIAEAEIELEHRRNLGEDL